MASETGIIYQIIVIGNYAKVTAVDEATGLEVSLAAPKNTPVEALKAAARKKLTFVMNKNKQSS